ncbi:MAG: hypothetical protein R3300_21865 [Candidatus Promineifilaceae bacterium]|nr:hypothetical protein [Candidatus Promineifilaceae bacterium]
MPLPNFVMAGADRTRTTSLYHYFAPHPQVFLSPIKEVRFFIYAGQNPGTIAHPFPERSITGLAAYKELFAAATTETAL